jgi:Mrp family chromosome partitioning ATPase
MSQMDNLIKALERAKSDNKVKLKNEEISTSVKVKTKKNTNAINYTTTRIVNADADTLRQNRLITEGHPCEAIEAYRLLRTQILQRMRENDWTSLAITSPSSIQSQTRTSINLAISMAREVNQTVLLVDLDLRNPTIHQYFGHQPEAGICEHLHRGIPLNEVLFNPMIERLVILPGKEVINNSSETISAPTMIHLSNELRSRYKDRYVLFHLPAITHSDDVLAFSPNVDAVLLVIEEGASKTDELSRSMEILQTVNIIGTVFIRARGS